MEVLIIENQGEFDAMYPQGECKTSGHLHLRSSIICKNIRAGGSIISPGPIISGGYVAAGGPIESGSYIEAGRYIKAGRYIEAEGDITCGHYVESGG